MRNPEVYILFLLIVSLASCKEDSDKMGPTYTDITGDWAFSSSILSGELTILYEDSMYYQNEAANLIINGIAVFSDEPFSQIGGIRVYPDQGIVEGLSASGLSSGMGGYVYFGDAKYNSAFTELVVDRIWLLAENCIDFVCDESEVESVTVFTRI